MADAVHSIPATILPFPSGNAANGLTRVLDDWQAIGLTLRHAGLYRGMAPAVAVDHVRAALTANGADPLADLMQDMASALKALRSAAAELAGVDRLLASAADRVLAEAGI